MKIEEKAEPLPPWEQEFLALMKLVALPEWRERAAKLIHELVKKDRERRVCCVCKVAIGVGLGPEHYPTSIHRLSQAGVGLEFCMKHAIEVQIAIRSEA